MYVMRAFTHYTTQKACVAIQTCCLACHFSSMQNEKKKNSKCTLPSLCISDDDDKDSMRTQKGEMLTNTNSGKDAAKSKLQ